MKLAVMQPYVFPYLGYYQLCHSVDKFVFYDDVNYIKQGYINRNTILNNGQPLRFTIPVPNASSFKKIKELEFSDDVRKTLETIKQSYSKCLNFIDVFPIIESVLLQKDRRISNLCSLSIEMVFRYLGLEKKFYLSSEITYDRDASAADRLISIAGVLNCSEYINAIGGVELYDKGYFLERGLNLQFIKMNPVSYTQLSNDFVANLSIIDVLMNCSKREILAMLNEYSLE